MFTTTTHLVIPSPSEVHALTTASAHNNGEWETAFHEAGHVIAHCATGFVPDFACINESGGGQMRSRKFIGVTDSYRRLGRRKGPTGVWAVELASNWAMVLHAGELAGLSALGWHDLNEEDTVQWTPGELDPDLGTDDERLLELTNHLRNDEWLEFHERTHAAAQLVLRDNWQLVIAVAVALIEHRSLDRAELDRIIDEIDPGFFERLNNSLAADTVTS